MIISCQSGATADLIAAPRRFEGGRHLLRDVALGIGEIAEQTGYADAGSFIRAFRRLSGTTPGEYRRQRR